MIRMHDVWNAFDQASTAMIEVLHRENEALEGHRFAHIRTSLPEKQHHVNGYTIAINAMEAIFNELQPSMQQRVHERLRVLRDLMRHNAHLLDLGCMFHERWVKGMIKRNAPLRYHPTGHHAKPSVSSLNRSL